MRNTCPVLAGLGLYFCFAGLLLAAQSTTPPTGRFGLPATTTKLPSTTASAAPASSTSDPASAPAAPPANGSPTTGVIQRGADIVVAVAYGTLAKQGKIADGNKVECIKYQFNQSRPLDPNTGLPTGAARPNQITITKHWDGASTQFLQALATNETLQTLTLEFLGNPAVGKQVPYFTVTLTNATVVGVHQYMENKVALEDVVLTFNKMTLSGDNKSAEIR